MPTQTQAAVTWALSQTVDDGTGKQVPITKDDAMNLVDAVRSYFNINNITYSTFSYVDLEPFLN